MTSVRAVTIVSVALVFVAQPGLAQDLSRYRGYALESSVASVVEVSSARQSDIRTRHERPAKIQELEWRAPYVPSGRDLADPVREVQFSFFDDQLYRIVVTYDRNRINGLTNDDIIASFSATYGVPLLPATRTAGGTSPTRTPTDTRTVARWEDASTMAVLTRGTDARDCQFVLTSKQLDARARAAANEALRLDRQEAPQRELDQHNKEAGEAAVASQKARVVNKPAFRP